ncbi:MAG: hypothetical protein ACJA2K_001710 [Thalassolituus sp.]|jgi:uncharacterized protein (DUF2164 family)|tara:strand:+ start:798 stop:1043 length:246 start_codon:yes stop_codon:yes gene_type:complete
MSKISLSREDTDRLVAKIKTYFNNELDQEIGGFEAEFLIEFFAKEIGPSFYNQGLSDAQTIFSEKTDEVYYSLQELEKPLA